MVWGYRRDIDSLFRVDFDGVIEFFHVVNLVPSVSDKFNVGTVDTNGYLYLYQKGATEFHTVDINPERSTYLKLVDPTNGFEEKTSAPWGVPMTARLISDWAYNPNDGWLYAMIDGISGTNAFCVWRINPQTGAAEFVTSAVDGDSIRVGGSQQVIGSCFFDADGIFYVFGNYTGHLYSIDMISATATRASAVSTPASNNDGAFCPMAVYVPDPMSVDIVDFSAYIINSQVKLN